MTDPYNPYSTGPVQNSFLMPIEDIFHLKQRGIVVTGRIERGMLQMGDSIDIVGMKEPIRQAHVREIEMFRKILTVAQAGNNVGCLLDGITAHGPGARAGLGEQRVDQSAQAIQRAGADVSEGEWWTAYPLLRWV
jgi:GTPase